MLYNNISVLVVSCDKYADLWPIFFNAYFKYWHDSDMPVYLGSNFKTYPDDRVKAITIGNDESYTDNLLKMLSKIDSENVIILIDDIFLSKKINSESFNKYIENFLRNNAVYLKLIYTYPLSSNSEINNPISNISKFTRYRVGVAAAIWKKKWLVDNLPQGYTAWELEKRQFGFEKIPEQDVFAINKNFQGPIPFEFVHGVVKGRWYREAIPYIKKQGFSHILKGRETQPLLEYLYVKLYRFIMWIFIQIGYVWK